MFLWQSSLLQNFHMPISKKIFKRFYQKPRFFCQMVRKFLLRLLWVYQKFFTVIGFGSCRFYPTCSEYAKIHFENNSVSSAFYHTFNRILRCNQLFRGGIEYPLLDKLSIKPAKMGIDSIKYWLVPNKKNRYYIIKNFSYKG